MTLELFIWIILVVYGMQTAIFLLGLRRLKDAATNVLPTVSVVIAARNEEHNIGACIDSVCVQTMAADRYEVIVVDDESTDATANVVREKMHHFPHLRLHPVRSDLPLRGKSRPLASGIEAATGEVILMTDADCTVPATWVEQTAHRYAADVGLVGGVTLQRSNDAFGGMQSLDWAYLLGIAASGVAWGTSFGSIGNNLSFRKKAYEEVGGYQGLPFSVTEDYTLVRAILKTGSWKQVYPIDPAVTVESAPCPDVAGLIHQKHRWGRGGLDVQALGFVMMIITWLLHVLPIVYLVGWGDWGTTATVYFIKTVFDYIFLNSVVTRLNRRSDLEHFPLFELYYSVYVVVLPFLVFLGGNVRWKGRTY